MNEIDALIWIATNTDNIVPTLNKILQFFKTWFVIWLLWSVWRYLRKS